MYNINERQTCDEMLMKDWAKNDCIFGRDDDPWEELSCCWHCGKS